MSWPSQRATSWFCLFQIQIPIQIQIQIQIQIKFASKGGGFFQGVEIMGRGSLPELKQKCFSAKLDCNSRTKIFVLTVTGCYTLTLTNYIFVITGWYTLTNYIGHVLGWLVWAQSIILSGAMLCKSGGSLYCIWV